MSATDQQASSQNSPAAGNREAGFRLSLSCPKCSATGWIEWKHLNHGLRCSKCGCQFLVTPAGHVRAQAELPQIRFSCPRCHRSGSIPDLLSIGGAECLSCRLPLVRGPDQRLHGLKEAQELRRAATEPSHGRGAAMGWFLYPNGSLRTSRAMAVVVGLVALLALGGWWLRSWFHVTPEALARRFTYVCLSGRWDRAESYLEDDAVQRAEFDRWRLRYFSSILDKHRPKGDRLDIAIESRSPSAETRVFKVLLTSDFLGTRTLEECWRNVDGVWRFDARATLALHEAPRPKPAKPAVSTVRPKTRGRAER